MAKRTVLLFTSLVAAGALGGLLVSAIYPSAYRSTATLMFSDLNADASREHVLRTEGLVLSRAGLMNLIQSPQLNLYPELRQREPIDDVIDRARRDLQIKPTAQGSAQFEISFTYNDPAKAQGVIQQVITRFMEEEARRAVAEPQLNRTPAEALQAQIAKLETEVTQIAKRLDMPVDSVLDDAVPAAYHRLEVIDPPLLPAHSLSPSRSSFVALGALTGLSLALILVMFL